MMWKSSKVEGYLLAEVMQVSKASLGKHPPLLVMFPPVYSSPSPTFWGTGFVSLLFSGCKGVLGCYQHFLLFGLTCVLPYVHTFPINTCTPGHGELSPAFQPLKSQLRADHRSQDY